MKNIILFLLLLTLSPVRGLITAVNEGSVEVQDSAGKRWQFELSKEMKVPLAHLREHLKEKWPVSVHYQKTKENKNIATKITD